LLSLNWQRDQQYVHDVHPRPELGCPGEWSAEDRQHQRSADDRDRQPHPVADLQSDSGQQIVDQRVAQIALQQRCEQQDQPDDPGQLAWLAERAGEEHPHQVDHDRGHEHVRRPVVGLAHQQPGLDREREFHHRAVGVTHRAAVERRIGAVVDGMGGAWIEEQRQVDPGGDQHDERVQRDFPQQERPMVRKQVAHGRAQQRRRGGALVDEADRVLDWVRHSSEAP
jgi:hypothetical protein